MIRVLIVLLSSIYLTSGQSYHLPDNIGSGADCFSKFPYLKKRFSWEQLEFFCQQKRAFDDVIFNNTVQPFSPAQLTYLNALAVDYMDGSGPGPGGSVIRKEIRRLTDGERRTLEAGMRNLKVQLIDGVSKYDLLVMQHHPALAPGAHVGAAFLPWHREYLRRFETALRQINRNIALPFWDSTLDEALIDPLDSVLWTPTFFGNPTGFVRRGPYRNWGFRPDNETKLIRLQRDVGINGSLVKSDLKDFIIAQDSYKKLTACIDLTVERTSRNLHEWIGGAMASIYYSPQDPIFFYHHVYLDYLWGLFRVNQTETEKRYSYPPNYEACTKFHYGNSIMEPFGPLKNIDGLASGYGDYYRYEYSPECQDAEVDCGSKYLFCHPDLKRCVSKLKLGGNCMTLPNEACMSGTCSGGMCTSRQPKNNNRAGPSTIRRRVDRRRKVDRKRETTDSPSGVKAVPLTEPIKVKLITIRMEDPMTPSPKSSVHSVILSDPVFDQSSANVSVTNLTDTSLPGLSRGDGPPTGYIILPGGKPGQTPEEDADESQGRHVVTMKPRPKHQQRPNSGQSADLPNPNLEAEKQVTKEPKTFTEIPVTEDDESDESSSEDEDDQSNRKRRNAEFINGITNKDIERVLILSGTPSNETMATNDTTQEEGDGPPRGPIILPGGNPGQTSQEDVDERQGRYQITKKPRPKYQKKKTTPNSGDLVD